MIKSSEEIEQEIKELYPYPLSYKRKLTLEILQELEDRKISIFDFLNLIISSEYTKEDNTNKLEDYDCLKNYEIV